MRPVFLTTYANRYTKGRELAAYLGTITGFSPGVEDLTIAKLTDHLNSIEAANSEVASKRSLLQTVQSERAMLVKGEDGLISRASQVRDYLASILPKGKKAKDYEKAQKIVRQMRGYSHRKKSETNEEAVTTKSISTFEVTFASILGNGRDMLNWLSRFQVMRRVMLS